MTKEKSITLTLHSGDLVISTENSILSEAEKQGVLFEYNCRKGHCGACLKTLIEGSVRYPFGVPLAFIPTNKILTCCAYATSDLKIK